MKKYISLAGIFVSFFYAQAALAAPLLDQNTDLSKLIDNIKGILNTIIPLLIGLAVVFFLYGVMVFIIKSSAGNADGRKEGINFMIFGVIGIAVMVSVWGLVNFVTATLGTSSGPGAAPQFNGSGSQAPAFNSGAPGAGFGPMPQ